MPKTILVVDDDPLYVGLVKDVLEIQHHKVVVAYNGAEALTLVPTQAFDLIVSDIEMPEMNGITFHKRLSERETLKQIPFVFLTGTEDTKHLHYAREHPSIALLRKADVVEQLLAFVSALTTSTDE
jgi:CheY-like chemotaxis protein